MPSFYVSVIVNLVRAKDEMLFLQFLNIPSLLQSVCILAIAKLSSSWQVQCQLNWELILVLISVTPTHPTRASIFEAPWKLKFDMEVLFN